MKEIFNLLPILFIAITLNIAAGIYYNIGGKNMRFDIKKLVTGLIKAFIIAAIFVGTSFCFEATDLSSIGITPMFMMTSAITLYVGKALTSLAKILGIEIKINSNKENDKT